MVGFLQDPLGAARCFSGLGSGWRVYYLWTEHQAHILSALSYLILLLCPLMHLFMHHDHGGHRKDDEGHTDENH